MGPLRLPRPRLGGEKKFGEKKFSRAPGRLGAPPSLKNTEKGVLACFLSQICTKSIFDRGSAWGSLRRSPGPLVGCWGGRPLPISLHHIHSSTEWGCDGASRLARTVSPAPLWLSTGLPYNVTLFGSTSTYIPNVKSVNVIAVNGTPISQLRDVTCHMGSHSVTCHPTQVNAPRLNPSQ